MKVGAALQVVDSGPLPPDPMEQEPYSEFRTPEDSERDALLLKDNLAQHVRTQWRAFRDHKSSIGVRDSLLASLQTYNGQYHPDKLTEIKKFGGSEVYARVTTVKCRGATSMLRDVFLGAKRPWSLDPTPVPEIPDEVMANIDELVVAEAQAMMQAGQPVDAGTIQRRRQQLVESADRAAMKTAKTEAEEAERKLDDILIEGGLYDALGEFLVDLPIFKFAGIKGPQVRMQTGIQWVNGQMTTTSRPHLYWTRINPFNLYFTPGATSIADADVIEKTKVSRSDVNQLIGLPGYDEAAIRAVLTDYATGLVDFIDDSDGAIADEEGREDPHTNDSELLDMIEYHGRVQGKILLDYGVSSSEVPDKDRDYSVSIWMIGRYVIKVQINPNPKRRHPYYITSYEKVPGSIIGHGLPELIQDIQDVGNAALRSLVNNMSIASGPQVVVNEERLSPTTDGNSLYPWKRWRVVSDPMGMDTTAPVTFFQPQSNAQELLGIYRAMMDLADDVSAIPRYITGSEKVGGAASTASGLSMLMGNASKVLQNVASQIDHDIMEPLLEDLYTMVMLTDTTGMLRGDERISVKGVAVAIQKETDRMRKLEFLQITGNPMDAEIVGIEGRAALLRALADELGMPEANIVPTEDELRARLEQQAALAAAQEEAQLGASQDAGARASGAGRPAASLSNPAPMPGQGRGRMASATDNMHRTNTARR